MSPDGTPKLLDFGLAKAYGDDAAETGLSQSPTLSRGTAVGVILGTAPYMSPEQARGKSVDKRTDIWEFGCCFYEALTGKPAFMGETVTDTMPRSSSANRTGIRYRRERRCESTSSFSDARRKQAGSVSEISATRGSRSEQLSPSPKRLCCTPEQTDGHEKD